jgi:WD40 repeat protein
LSIFFEKKQKSRLTWADFFVAIFIFKMKKITRRNAYTGHRAALYALAVGASERHFLSAGGDGWITEWHLDQPDAGRVVAQVEGQIFSLKSHPAGLLLAGDMLGGLHWIDRQQPADTRHTQAHTRGVYDIFFLENQLFTAGGDGVLTRWNLPTRRATESLHLSHRALRSLAFSEKNNLLAVGASDGSIYLLDPNTLAVLHRIEGAHTPSVFAVAWSPDGRYLLSGGRDALLHVWDAEEDFGLVSSQAAHLFTINHLEFSPDGRHFATASRDKSIRIWDATTFQLQKALETVRDHGHLNSVNRLLWLPDALLSCSDDRTVVEWSW